jgi:hypothetical protein
MQTWQKDDGSPGQIVALLPKLMRAVGPLAKRRQGPKYKFRSIDDLLVQLQPAMIRLGIVSTHHVLDLNSSTRPALYGGVVTCVRARVAVRYHAPDGTYFETVTAGEGADYTDKAVNKAITGAVKNAHLHTLSIPTGTKRDSEYEQVDARRSHKAKLSSGEAKKVANEIAAITDSARLAELLERLIHSDDFAHLRDADRDALRKLAVARWNKLADVNAEPEWMVLDSQHARSTQEDP